MQAKLAEIKKVLRERMMHRPIPAQGGWLKDVVAGWFTYRAVATNGRALASIRFQMVDLWRHRLRRRSQKDQTSWAGMRLPTNDWLPKPRLLHPWSDARFAVKPPK